MPVGINLGGDTADGQLPQTFGTQASLRARLGRLMLWVGGSYTDIAKPSV
jgi:hypothetical protein